MTASHPSPRRRWLRRLFDRLRPTSRSEKLDSQKGAPPVTLRDDLSTQLEALDPAVAAKLDEHEQTMGPPSAEPARSEGLMTARQRPEREDTGERFSRLAERQRQMREATPPKEEG